MSRAQKKEEIREDSEDLIVTLMKKRPAIVQQACLLQVLSAVLTVVTTINGFDHYKEMAVVLGREAGSMEQFFFSRSVSVLLSIGLAYLFYHGRNWARLFFIAFFILNSAILCWSITLIGSVFLEHLWELDTIISIFQIIISAVVCAFLLTHESSEWFRAVKKAREEGDRQE